MPKIDNNQPLVSIISPCYNGEKYLKRFLDSILAQTYNNIEFIFVNDGSTDSTEQVVMGYKQLFEEKGIDFKYIFQSNKGQAAALNQGLKIFGGEYLTWPDSDDILHYDNIEKKVEFLENNKEVGFVLCKTKVVNEADTTKQIGTLWRYLKKDEKDNLFSDLIFARNIYYTPGGYMVRASAFLDMVPSRAIYETHCGQNWQMLLPVAYKYKCGYLPEYLFTYVVRGNSHSRKEKTVTQAYDKLDIQYDCLTNVINSLSITDEDLLHKLSICFLKRRFYLACEYKNQESAYLCLSELRREHSADIKIYLTYYRLKNKVFSCTINICKAPVRLLRKIKRNIE